MPDVTMPKLSDTMEEGKILRWRKQPGDTIAVGDLLVEVETDKADMEVEASAAGVLREVRLEEGESAPVGAVIAVIDADGNSAAARPAAKQPEPADAPRSEARSEEGDGARGKASAEPPRPAASRTAARPGPAKVPPPAPPRRPERREESRPRTSSAPRATHEEGASTRPPGSGAPAQPGSPGSGTVLVRPPPARPAPHASTSDDRDVQRIPLSSMRASIARRMTESKREAPHFYVDTTVDMDLSVKLRAAFKESGGAVAGITYNHLILKACAQALAAHPELNARFVGDAIEILPEINLGVATALPEGLIVPVIHRVDRASLVEIAARARELQEKARQRSFTSEDLSGATFSVSNLGMYEIDSFTAVINPPQAAILAVGAVRQQPVVRDGALAIGHTVHLTLSCDHRTVDGVQAARFLSDLRKRLENPIALLIPSEEG